MSDTVVTITARGGTATFVLPPRTALLVLDGGTAFGVESDNVSDLIGQAETRYRNFAIVRPKPPAAVAELATEAAKDITATPALAEGHVRLTVPAGLLDLDAAGLALLLRRFEAAGAVAFPAAPVPAQGNA